MDYAYKTRFCRITRLQFLQFGKDEVLQSLDGRQNHYPAHEQE